MSEDLMTLGLMVISFDRMVRKFAAPSSSSRCDVLATDLWVALEPRDLHTGYLACGPD